MINFDDKAMEIVKEYITGHLDKSDPMPNFQVFTVWKCKTLQNWKYLLSSTLFDGMYYELTYNGDKCEWYLDAYKEFQNVVVKEDGCPVRCVKSIVEGCPKKEHKEEK